MMVAGFDTTTSALSWTLYAVARWPEHQMRIQEEVGELLEGRSNDDILW
jgi:cytochrome P450